ncbi:MAG: glycosyltransferase [bacterium]|nr:glycosyltransferase [bacterium]
MRILILNQDWFAQEWRASGHEVVTCGQGDRFDINVDTPLRSINDIILQAKFSGTPDAIVYLDNSMPLTFLDLESIDIPILFYSVDAHHHVHWHKYFSLVCAKTLVAHKDYLPEFIAEGVNAEWMPVWASRIIEPSQEKKHKVVFVGTLDTKLNPDRLTFFEALKKLVPIEVISGEFWKIFPHSQIVINQTVKGDLNFRVFESLMSGSLLLTEKSTNGLLDLFEDGKHFITYSRNNVEEAANAINIYLSKPELCKEIGNAGREEVLKKHTTKVRAQEVLDRVQLLSNVKAPYKNYAAMLVYVISAIKYEEVSLSHSVLCLTRAMQLMELALTQGEPITEQLVVHAILGCFEFDRMMGGKMGAEMLVKLGESYHASPVLRLAAMRSYLNYGMKEKAMSIIQDWNVDEDVAIFTAEEVSRQIMNMKKSNKDGIRALTVF